MDPQGGVRWVLDRREGVVVHRVNSMSLQRVTVKWDIASGLSATDCSVAFSISGEPVTWDPRTIPSGVKRV